MLARRLLASALVMGLAVSGIGNKAHAQTEKKQDAKKGKAKATAKWVQKSASDEKVDEGLKKRVMGQLKKSLKKFEKELGEKKMAGILKSVEQSLSGAMNQFHFEFKDVDGAEIHRKMAEKLGQLEKTLVIPQMSQLHGGDRKVIGVMLEAVDGKPVKIQQVIKGSAAEKAGIKAGDVVITVNGKKVGDPQSLTKQVQSSKGPIKIEVQREGEEVILKVEPKTVKGHGIAHGILKLDDLGDLKDGGIFEIHKDLIEKVVIPEGAEGKAKKLILVNPDDIKKRIELKIDKASSQSKQLRNKADEMQKKIQQRIEIRSDLGESIEQLKKQMKELQEEIKKLKKGSLN